MTDLFAHQRDALAFLEERPTAAITAGLGTGKTRIVLEDARAKGAGLVVVCPKSAISVWESEMEKWAFGLPSLVLNYERLWRNANGMAVNEGVVRFIRQLREDGLPVMVVLDEAHRIKDRTTRQSKSARKLAPLAAYRRTLTGTPVVNGYHDLWAQYDFLRPELLGKWTEFAKEHVVFSAYYPGKVEFVRNIPEIQRRIVPYTFHVNTDDVLDLPESTDLERVCDLEPIASKVYEELEEDLYTQLPEGEIYAPTALVKLLRLAQVSGGFVNTDMGVQQVSGAKLQLLAEVVEELGDEKFVVFCRFTAEREAIWDLLRDMGVKPAWLYGGQAAQERGAAVSWWSKPEGPQALVAQIQVGSASIDLTAARYALYYSVGFSFGDYEQSRARIRRYGQKRAQFYVHLTCKDTIDAYIYRALARKQGVHEAVKSWWEDRRRAA